MDRFGAANGRPNIFSSNAPFPVLSDKSTSSTTPFAHDDRLGSFTSSSTSFCDGNNASLRGSLPGASADIPALPSVQQPSGDTRKEKATQKTSQSSSHFPAAVAERSGSRGTRNSDDDGGGGGDGGGSGRHQDPAEGAASCQCVPIAPKSQLCCGGMFILPFYLPQEWREPLAKAAEALKHPIAIATLVMIGMLTVSGALLFFTLTGMWRALGGTEEKLWFEFSNQILNGVCTVSCLVMHPLRCYYVVQLVRWNRIDVASLRALLSAAGAFVAKPDERFHMSVVLTLLQLNCIFQYAIEVILWTIPEPQRPVPLIAFLVCIALGSPFTAGLYCIFSPLGWATADPPVRRSFRSFGKSSTGSHKSVSESHSVAGESQGAKATPCALCDGVIAGEGKAEVVVVVADGQAHGETGKQSGEEQQCAEAEEPSLAEGGKPPAPRRFGEYEELLAGEGHRTLKDPKQWRIPVWQPEGERSDDEKLQQEGPQWQGTVFDCCAGGWRSAVSSTVCCFCVHGRHVERAGFGNRIVFTATFIFFIFGPIVIFTMGARNTPNTTMQWFVFSLGVLGSFLGVTYGGYWRWKVRRTFLLQEQVWCCGHKAATDFASWYVLPCCSLCQEVRTVRHYRFHMLPHLPDETPGEEQGAGQGKAVKGDGETLEYRCRGCGEMKGVEGGGGKAAMQAPAVEALTNLAHEWDDVRDASTWMKGRDCDSMDHVKCDGDGRVIALTFKAWALNGSLPTALLALSHLKDLAHPIVLPFSLTPVISNTHPCFYCPFSVFACAGYLAAHRIDLKGLSNLQQLTRLSLSNNYLLTSQLDGLSQLQKLQSLSLEGNYRLESLPVGLSQLQKLQSL
ncbi:unnamed protein product [Closterium sp. NIES-64]|nr:unnamed protein product [Closterium sp. NIES-64]